MRPSPWSPMLMSPTDEAIGRTGEMEIRVEARDHHIVVVTIDNPPRRNAMTRAMLADLAALWDRLDGSDCRCVVLTGAGDRAFSSGADLGGDLSADTAMAR